MYLWDYGNEDTNSTILDRMKRQAGASTGRRPANVPQPPATRTSNSDR